MSLLSVFRAQLNPFSPVKRRQSVPTSAEDLVGGPWLQPQHWSSDGTQPWCSRKAVEGRWTLTPNSALAGVARGVSAWSGSRHLVVIIESFYCISKAVMHSRRRSNISVESFSLPAPLVPLETRHDRVGRWGRTLLLESHTLGDIRKDLKWGKCQFKRKSIHVEDPDL